jgi:HEAT repeat protein
MLRFTSKSILWAGCLFALSAGFAAAETAAPTDPFQAALSKLSDKNPQVRRQGADALGQMRNAAAAEPLRNLLKDSAPSVRSAAVDALGLLRNQPAAAAIARLLETDPDANVRQNAAIALGYIADRTTLPSLVKGLKDSQEPIRFASINSLGILRDAAAVEPLTAELKNPDARMRSSSAYALGNIADAKALPALKDALELAASTVTTAPMTSPAVAAAVARTLGLIGDPSSVDLLKPLLDHPDRKVALSGALALAKLKDKSGLAFARKSAKDSDANVRRAAAEILAQVGTAEDAPVLQKLASDPDASVKNVANLALERWKKPAAPARKTAPETPRKTKKQ